MHIDKIYVKYLFQMDDVKQNIYVFSITLIKALAVE